MSRPLISIITPVYNGERYLGETIDSVRHQTFSDWEHIFVDDCSTDSSRSVIRDRGDKERTVYIRHDENRRIPAARNTGIEAARGKYIAFIDQDDLWLPEKLEGQLAILEKDPGAALCYGRNLYFRYEKDSVRIEEVFFPAFHHTIRTMKPDELASRLFLQNFVAAGSVLIRASVLREAGGFDETLTGGADDYDLWLRLSPIHSFAWDNRLLLLSRSHSTNYTDAIRSSDDSFRILGAVEKTGSVPVEIVSRRYEIIHYKRTVSHLLSGRYEESLQELQKVISCSGRKPRYLLANVLIRMGGTGAALFSLFRAISSVFNRMTKRGRMNRVCRLSPERFDMLKNGSGKI